MTIVIHCPDASARTAIARHLIDATNDRLFFAETERTVVSLVFHNEIDLVLLFDPQMPRGLTRLKDFIRHQRNRTRVKVLPSRNGLLTENWRHIVNDALKPLKRRKNTPLGPHPRFKWKPTN
jgi:hypothetical protein